ncbi:WD repeat domain-containing protein 83 [Cytospora mali]|uniref:WD repeat domain-containing protein 83 n=1 Tax=Cytospora mali TaxID=578113 RepID=A0A194ULM8_CYTMA|nr:WD repeat domain-containing protein 83 [Valsa mali var. pyri (nom. inval.)]
MAFPYTPIAFLTGANGPIHALAYSASPGTYILTGSADRAIRLYNPSPSTSIHPANSYITKQQQQQQARGAEPLPEGRLIQTYQAHSHEVLSLSVSADNARFASSGGDRTVFLWDVGTAQTIRRFSHHTEGHVGRVNCVAMGGADDSLVVSGGFDTTVRIWDAKAGGTGFGKPVQVLDEATDAISAVVVRDAEVIAGSVDGRVRSYDIRMGRVTADVIAASVASLCLTADGKAVLVGSLDSRVRLMDRESGSCLRTYGADDDSQGWENTDLRVQSVLGGKEKYVVAGDEMTGTDGHVASQGGRIWAWDLMTGKLAAKVNVPWGPAGTERLKKVVGRDGKEKERKYVVSCLAWRENGFGDQFCAGGTSGAVTVFGPA